MGTKKKIKKPIRILINTIAVIGLILILLTLFLGGHPLITITSYKFDVINNPLDKYKSEPGVEVVTIREAETHFITSNGISIEKKRLNDIVFTSPAENQVLYLKKDGFSYIEYPIRGGGISCCEAPVLFCIPILIEHRNKFSAQSCSINEKNKLTP